MSRRGAAIRPCPADAIDAEGSSEPGTAFGGRGASNRRSRRPRRGGFRRARDPASPRLIESPSPARETDLSPRSVPAGQAVLQDVLRHQGAAHRRRQGTSARDPPYTPHAERATIARRPPRPLSGVWIFDTVTYRDISKRRRSSPRSRRSRSVAEAGVVESRTTNGRRLKTRTAQACVC